MLIGNSIADDTMALQDAIDMTPEFGTLTIPKGVYKISRTIGNYAYTGYGGCTYALKITKPITIKFEGGAMLKAVDGDEFGLILVYNTRHVHIEGGRLFRKDKAPGNNYMGIMFFNCYGCTVKGTYLKHTTQGVNMFQSDGCLISKVTVEETYGCGIISCRSSFNIIKDCVVSNAGDGHISLWGDGVGEYNRVMDCHVNEDTVTSEQGITVENEKYSAVTGCTLRNFYYGIDLKNGAFGNYIYNNYVTESLYGVSIRPGDAGQGHEDSDNNLIKGNVVLFPRNIWPNRGIYVGAGTGNKITENVVGTNRLVYKEETIRGDETWNGNEFVNNSIIPAEIY